MQAKTRKPSAKSENPGVRERLRRQNQHKITVAARRLFAELGFERATLKEIATAAGLSTGALFNHVTDKRDLIYLVFNEEVDIATTRALGSTRPYQSLAENILSIMEHYFRLFASEPVLSRILLNEVVIQSPGLHLDEYLMMRARLTKGLEQLLAEAQASREIHSEETAEVMARHIFFTLAASLRWWLASSPYPEWRAGHREYARLLKLQIGGLISPMK